MARIIPDYFDPSLSASPGERLLFEAFKKGKGMNDWTVFHSLNIAKHVNQQSGEADFVVIAPGLGVLVLEVKAHQNIWPENGGWYFGSNTNRTNRSPFKQAETAMYSLRNYVKDNAPGLERVPFFSAAVFTHFHFAYRSPEWEEWQVINFTGQSGDQEIGPVLKVVFDHARQKLRQTLRGNLGGLSVEDAKKIEETFQPKFHCTEKFSETLERGNRERIHFTKEQFGHLEALKNNDRVVFPGLAGTGKTILALEAARRATSANQKTLLICYNKALGQWLSQQTYHNLSAGNIHWLMHDIARFHVPKNATRDFWENDCPRQAVDHLRQRAHFQPYDFLIVDEAQDVIKQTNIEFLDTILKGGLKEGRWCFFGDFSNQDIHSRENPGPDIHNLRQHLQSILSFDSFSIERELRNNCRNTHPIVQLLQRITHLEPGYDSVLRPGTAILPEIQYYNSAEDQSRKINQLFVSLLQSPVDMSNLAVLTERNENTLNTKLAAPFAQSVCSLADRAKNPQKAVYSTIHAFKGMEVPVVVLTDVDDLKSPYKQSLFYVGASRAQDQLYILAHESCRSILDGHRVD